MPFVSFLSLFEWLRDMFFLVGSVYRFCLLLLLFFLLLWCFHFVRHLQQDIPIFLHVLHDCCAKRHGVFSSLIFEGDLQPSHSAWCLRWTINHTLIKSSMWIAFPFFSFISCASSLRQCHWSSPGIWLTSHNLLIKTYKPSVVAVAVSHIQEELWINPIWLVLSTARLFCLHSAFGLP